MPTLSALQIENAVTVAVQNSASPDFIYDFLLAYGLPQASITRLKNGSLNLANDEGDILWKKKLFYTVAAPGLLRTTVERCRRDESVLRYSPRFIIVSDGKTWAAFDRKTEDSLECSIPELYRHYDFFSPWAGREKAVIILENPVDIKAAQKMGDIYDALKKDNPALDSHDMNVFMARLLFCFFAEDSGIFDGDGAFTAFIKNNTLPDASDMRAQLDRIFRLMNCPVDSAERKKEPVAIAQFPYVNGGLFKGVHPVPVFSPKSRSAIIKAGDLDWSEINTDIFGNMFQACVAKDKRACLGEHYTSVPNIMKVLKPLFLDELTVAAENAKGDEKRAKKFIERISKIRFFDPACGSGNFLIVAFKELRRLEMEVLESVPTLLPMPSISINQFYGIEIDDFAHEIAMLSLWLVEHQMNLEFFERFGKQIPTLPLKPNEHIVLGNALRTKWEDVCPKTADEIYIFGNPPYLGGKKENEEQKKEQEDIFRKYGNNYKDLDYVSCWFMKAAEYIKKSKAKVGFVSTNSITQGTQVPNLWEPILSLNVEISFAYTSFKWTNNAKYQAGVACVIIGLSMKKYDSCSKFLYDDNIVSKVDNISPFLIRSENIFVRQSNKCLNDFPNILIGNAPVDDGNLILSVDEKNMLISGYPYLERVIKKYIGGEEFIRGKIRYCLWITDEMLNDVNNNVYVRIRINKVREFRISSKKAATRKLAITPHLFMQRTYVPSDSIIIPLVSSERREYIPMGYVGSDTVISNLAFAVYNAAPWVFGLLTSKMHMIWVRTIGSKMGTGLRYSATLCYNTFPLRSLSAAEKERVSEAAMAVLDAREAHPDKTPAELYDPDKMPANLRVAHENLDAVVDRLYRAKGFKDDGERLECLFELYREMTNK